MTVKICFSFVATFLLAMITPAHAQNVTVDASIDSFQLFIGEQAKLKLEVSLDAGKRLTMPQYDKELMEGIEIVERSLPDTQYLNNNKRMLVTQEYTITSFDTAMYYIKPIEVLVEGEPYFSKELVLCVYTFPVDTLNPQAFFGPKEIWEIPLSWNEWGPVVWLSLLLIVAASFALFFIKRYKDNKPIIRIVKIAPKIPPHIVALKEIERIKAEKSNKVVEDYKQYYTELTDAIRTYIRDRFGFSALEMTSGEIIEHLLKENDKESLKDLMYLLETADLVKFAKHHPMINENDLNLVNAIDFVNETKAKGEDSDKVAAPTEVKLVDERSKQAKALLLTSSIVLGCVAITALIFLVRAIYYLWF